MRKSDDESIELDDLEPGRTVDAPDTSIEPTSSSRITCLGNRLFEAADFLRTALVTQTLMARWVAQLIIALDRYEHTTIPEEVRKTWLGWLVVGAAFSASAATIVINKVYQHHKKEHPAAQDYLYALLSSSIVYAFLDVMTDFKIAKNIPFSVFIVATIAAPIASVISIKMVLKESHDRLVFQFNEENFPTFPEATRKEKLFNLVTNGFEYGTHITILFWTIAREFKNQSVSLTWEEKLVTLIYILCCGMASYKLTRYPKIFHGFHCFSKLMMDGALAYSALSGIAFHALMDIYQCDKTVCWDTAINSDLTIGFAILATAVGLFSATSLLFQFKTNHEETEALIDNVCSAPRRLYNWFSDPVTAKVIRRETYPLIP